MIFYLYLLKAAFGYSHNHIHYFTFRIIYRWNQKYTILQLFNLISKISLDVNINNLFSFMNISSYKCSDVAKHYTIILYFISKEQ